MRLVVVIIGLLLGCQSVAEERLLVGVASNFADTMQPIAAAFTEVYGVEVQMSSGSSGKLFAQIQQGAPFDVFLSADKLRAERLIEAGMSVESDTRLYALGQLMLWSADPALAGANCLEALRADATARVAVANPRTAPYGAAAVEYLEAMFPEASWTPRFVTGENIAQAAQFAAHGGARFGLLAYAQRDKLPNTGCRQRLAPGLHAPIEQHAIALIGYSERLALLFLDFLQDEAVPIIEAAGYLVDEHE